MIKQPNNSYNYELTTKQRGKIYISKTDDKWKDPKKRAILYAQYGVANVIPVDPNTLKQLEGSGQGLLSSFSQESFTPLSAVSNSVITTVIPGLNGGAITLNPPTNLLVASTSLSTGSDGSAVMNININFDSVPGATSYDVIAVPASAALGPDAVTNISVSHSGLTFNVSWAGVSNASNYVISASSGLSEYYSSAPITGTSGSVTVGSSGAYTISVTPYNSIGIGGQAGTTTATL
jgi:hypothetical protein